MTMRADDLILLATAHGIDLKGVAGASSNTRGKARQRKRTEREVDLGLDILPTVRGRETRTYKRPAWSIAELGRAASGVPRLPWLAACYSYAGDSSCYWELWRALALNAQRMAQQQQWAPRVLGRAPRLACGQAVPGQHASPQFYLLEIAQLVLDEQAHQHVFAAAPGLYALYLNIDDETWVRSIEPRYQCLRSRYLAWLETARSMIQRWLTEEDEEEGANVCA